MNLPSCHILPVCSFVITDDSVEMYFSVSKLAVFKMFSSNSFEAWLYLCGFPLL